VFSCCKEDVGSYTDSEEAEEAYNLTYYTPREWLTCSIHYSLSLHLFHTIKLLRLFFLRSRGLSCMLCVSQWNSTTA